ncbi:MAG: hypothetical protein QOC63_505, partial [Mycobacterium sp.]|nr:hypothetical protein [Mycobacterium sp.]
GGQASQGWHTDEQIDGGGRPRLPEVTQRAGAATLSRCAQSLNYAGNCAGRARADDGREVDHPPTDALPGGHTFGPGRALAGCGRPAEEHDDESDISPPLGAGRSGRFDAGWHPGACRGSMLTRPPHTMC